MIELVEGRAGGWVYIYGFSGYGFRGKYKSVLKMFRKPATI